VKSSASSMPNANRDYHDTMVGVSLGTVSRKDDHIPNLGQNKEDKNSSGDEIANVNFYAVRPEATRIR